MKKITLLLSFVCLLALAVGCTKSTEASITLKNASDALLTFPVAGASANVSFNSALEWTVGTTANWITVTPATGIAGDASITITVPENTSYDNLTGTVTIASGDKTLNITVNQGQVNSITVEGDYFWVNGDGGEVAIPVYTNISYEVIIPEDITWLTPADSKAVEEMDAVLYADLNTDYAYREAEVVIRAEGLEDTVIVAQGGSTWSVDMTNYIPQDAANLVSMAMLDGKLILCPGNGNDPVIIDPVTTEMEGTLDLDIEVGFVKNDDAGNMLICNHTVYDPASYTMNLFEVYAMSSLTDTPEEIISYQGYQPLGSRLSVRGDINGKALILTPYEGIADITLSNEIVYWTTEGGVVSDANVRAITGFVGLNWLPGYWNMAPENAPAVNAVSEEITDGLILSVYDEDVVYFVDGSTFAATSMMTPSGDAWGLTFNTAETRSYNGKTYYAMLPGAFWPQWGYVPQLLVYDITDIPAIISEQPVVTDASSLILYPSAYSFLDSETEVGVAACGDVVMQFEDGNMLVYYVDHNNHTMEAYKVQL